MNALLLVMLPLLGGSSHSHANATNRIDEERFVEINGISVWVTIKGNREKPAILFVHGGPGSPLTPYADAIYHPWEKDFVLIQWDQRGTGRTYGQGAPDELTPDYLRANPLTVEQMIADGIALSRYVTQYLEKKKLILFGTSWGSVPGAAMAREHPELFHAYIGHSQVVHPAAADAAAYDRVITLAQQQGDENALNILKTLGAPPYDLARHTGQFIRVVKKYQQQNASAPPDEWFVPSEAYNNETDRRNRSDGDDYSFVNYAGDTRLGVVGMCRSINLVAEGLTFDIPVFFIQGEHDLQTPVQLSREYFERIRAPLKRFILLPDAEHGFNRSVVEAHYDIMKKYIVPAIGTE